MPSRGTVPHLPVAAHDDYIGKTIAGKYRVEQMLGEGGMGKVYKATQVSLEKPVVLKVLRQALLSDERTVARFQREAKAASRLNHPNSISVLDFGQTEEGALYIAMEYVQGKDLHHILSREWPLPESRVIRVMSQVLSALADAHSAGVIHRDLKPENIMVEQRRGEPDFVKVLDFGIAKIVDGSTDDGPALTRAGFVCGTPEYMSPEQARGAQLDQRSDLYAVGVILYQLTSGLLPFDSDSAVGFATKHLTETPNPPSKRRPEARISPALERLIMKSMSKSPDDRPQSAAQFRSELLAVEKERKAGASRKPPTGPFSVSQAAPGVSVSEEETRILEGKNRRHQQEATATIRSPGLRTAVPSDDESTPAMTASSSWGFRLVLAGLVMVAGVLGALVIVKLTAAPTEVYLSPVEVESLSGQALPEYELAESLRRPAEAARLAEEGDSAWHQGAIDYALSRYLEAWRADPQAALALKIGELYLQKQMPDEARRWWARYRKENPTGRGIEYIEQMEAKP